MIERNRPIKISRSRIVQRVKLKLEQFGFPRLQMAVLVGITGGVGFLGSYFLLQAGLRSMPIRYLIAICIAYGVFLLLLGVWLRWGCPVHVDPLEPAPADAMEALVQQDRQHRHRTDGSSDLADAAVDGLGEGIGQAFGAACDAEDFAVLLLALLFCVVVLFSSIYVVYTAPVLFAELVVDGALSASLYRRVRGIDPHHWLTTALRRTIWPFLITGIVLVALGWAIQEFVPGADSIGDIFRERKDRYQFRYQTHDQ